MTNETEAPERIWLAADLTTYCHDPLGLREDDIEYTRADLSDAKDARIAELETAIQRQAGAAKTLRNLTLAEVQHIKDSERKEYVASKTLDSEREANAILTEENEALQARIAELDERNTALGEAVAYATQRIAELEALTDELDFLLNEGGEDSCASLIARAEAAEAKLAKAVRLMELSVELADWNTTLLDDVIFFITELKGTDQ